MTVRHSLFLLAAAGLSLPNYRHVVGFQISKPLSRSRSVLPTIRTEPTKSNSGSIISNNHNKVTIHNNNNHPTRLYSLQHLVDDITSATQPKTIFVGGKGGVGKTTTSSALAVKLAANNPDLKVLVVSTDPAHSLGDALDEDLRRGHGKPIVMTDPLTGGRLSACEVDAAAALQNFRQSLEAFDVERLADALGVSTDLLQGFGLQEFSSLLNNPPPGLDELVALSNVLDGENAKDFDVVVVDTAPTGHTLRLLALPQFLDGLLGKLIKLRMKLSGLASTLQAIFGNAQAEQRAQAIDNAVDKLEQFRTKMARLQSTLKDASRTSFVVVTIPTQLGIKESQRLMQELQSQGVQVTDVVVNQCVADFEGQSLDKLETYYERRKAGQGRWIATLKDTMEKVSASPEFKENGNPAPIALTEVPFLDVELVGVPALYYLGSQCFMDNPNFSHLMEDNGREGDYKVLICGGKGGVGKTTTSSSLAVSMAAKGHNVALISTDPAHSLGDAVEMNLKGGNLMDCPLVGVPPGEGSLQVLEIDPTQSLGQFKGLVDKLIGGSGDSEGGSSGLRNTLKELEEVFDTLPAGTDEVVALAKVINLVKKGGFDRIVIDTAPTGHTLRMLSTPSFLAELIDRLLAIAEKVNSNAAVKMLITSQASSEQIETAAATAKSTLLSFQLQMYDLEDLFADPYTTEFIIVTVPTELAVRESTRLLNDLTFEAPDMPIKVRNVVANQVLKDDGSDAKTYLSHVHQAQTSSLRDLQTAAATMNKAPVITTVPYLDTEPRGVFGLNILAEELLKDD